jgi:hypothetical protein
MSLKETIIELKSGKRIYGMLVDRGVENTEILEYICNNKIKSTDNSPIELLIEQLPLSEVKSVDLNLK